jgi:phosphotransferase system enzyme I (PtsI)
VSGPRELKGVPVSQGIGIGHALLLDEETYHIPRINILRNQIENETKRFLASLEATKIELQDLQKKIFNSTGKDKADFFNLHLLIIEDENFVGRINGLIRDKLQNAEWAIYEIIDLEVKKLLAIEDDYIRDRVTDLYDIGKRILRHLQKREKRTLDGLKPDTILVAGDLTPAETATLDLTKIRGFVTDAGGKTSHTAILARAIGIPAVVGTVTASRTIRNGDLVIVDSNTGTVVVKPEEKTLHEYKLASRIYDKFRHDLEKNAHLESVTLDGRKILVMGNIEIPEEADLVLKNGGAGIGLYRTEYFYLNRPDLPSEEELCRVFRDVAARMKPHPVVFRTLDIGGDKLSDAITGPELDANPFLGWRAIRYCLENIDLFKAQLRAILRASAFGKVRLMLPMISDVSEIVKTKVLMDEIRAELDAKGEPYDPEMQTGAMIEIPSAVLTADTLAKETNFFSVGSNDLIQYTLAVDRTNPKIANLFEPFHPSVLILLKQTVMSAKKAGIKVSICGEMGSDPVAIPLLLGLGFDELSVSPTAIPQVKRVIRSLSWEDARNLADGVLKMERAPEIHTALMKFLKDNCPDVFNQKQEAKHK